MPFKCSVFGCSGNYDKREKVSVFKLPKDKNLEAKWIQRIMRKDFQPSSSTRVCEKHFRKEDILREVEYFDNKSGRILKSTLSYPRLKEGAIPAILPSNCPSYLQPTASTSRESPDRKRSRLEDSTLRKALEDSCKTQQLYEKEVSFSSLQELHIVLQRQKIDEFWTICNKKDCVLIMHISKEPDVICSITIDTDLNVTVNYKKVPLHKVDNIQFPLKVTNVNILCDIMCKLKALTEFKKDSVNGIKNICDLIIYLFEMLKSYTSFPESHLKFVDFVIEQISKMNVPKNQIRHSPDLLLFCSLLSSISPHCYKFLRNSEFFILPHPSTLRRMCSEFSINPSDEQNDELFLTYISQKFSGLEEKEKFVTLMIDEIHLKPNFDYVGGKLTGMAFNGTEAASSAYVFMVQSLLSPYKDVAHILPVSNFTAELFYSMVNKVVVGLEQIGYNVIAIITDNNAINSKAISFFSTPPEERIQYKNPVYPERPLFYLIDSVHILKCIRNNWLNQKNHGKCMFFPNFENPVLPFSTASFEALKKLHELECMKLLKYGYGLTLKALGPSSLDRQNVKLALQILNPRAAEGLLFVGEEHNIDHYKETAEYIKIICKWWSIMNVKTLYKGEHKLDNYQKPLAPNDTDVQYVFLNKFLKWLEKWDDMKCDSGALSTQTHSALKHTTTAMLALAKYCFKNLNFSFFLPGKVQTDSLENRFGSYRQLAGSQYNISIRQVYETETKLRFQSILPIILKSKSCGEFQLSLFDDKRDWEEMLNSTNIDFLSRNISITPNDIVEAQSDMPILTYVSGYAVHTIMKKIKCDQCYVSLVSNKSLDVTVNNEWISKLDRGGLKYPHPDVVCITIFTYAVVKKLLSSDHEETFLQCQNQRCVVCNISLDVLQENEVFLGIDDCEIGHDFQSLTKHIVWVTANILLNNYCKRQNDLMSKKKDEKKSLKKQKMRKLETLKK